MRKPMPSSRPSVRCFEPEMISASLGSATRHMSLKIPTMTISARTTAPATTPMTIGIRPLCLVPGRHRTKVSLRLRKAMVKTLTRPCCNLDAHGSHLRRGASTAVCRLDVHGARRQVLHHHHHRAPLDTARPVRGIREEVLGAAAHADHHLADQPGPDGTRDTPHQA